MTTHGEEFWLTGYTQKRGLNHFYIKRTRFLIFQRDFWLRRTIFLISYRDFQRYLMSDLPLAQKDFIWGSENGKWKSSNFLSSDFLFDKVGCITSCVDIFSLFRQGYIRPNTSLSKRYFNSVLRIKTRKFKSR